MLPSNTITCRNLKKKETPGLKAGACAFPVIFEIDFLVSGFVLAVVKKRETVFCFAGGVDEAKHQIAFAAPGAVLELTSPCP